ncbi:hypothetical protein ACFXHA_35070 [Nocardia sp. NPDC059240]|uniref:hypothetical protein n=1 Tax=Nocardia sp. NPDC059240 TaxID=3346786 RepID=UPI0036C91BEA
MRTAYARMAFVVGAVIVVTGCGTKDQQDTPTGGALFDPCTDIKDDVFRKAGFDPATKKHPVAEFPDRCSVDATSGGGLLMEHQTTYGLTSDYDRSLANDRAGKNSAQIRITTINGRDAYTVPRIVTVLDSPLALGCDANLRTKLGVLNINISSDAGTCPAVLRAATLIEPSIGPNR